MTVEYHSVPSAVNGPVAEPPPATASQEAQEPARPLGRLVPGTEGLPARLPSSPWAGRSGLGVLVRLTQEVNRYRDAQPYFTVSYGLRAGGRAQITRHTPSRDRALALLTWFLRDRTDPQVLRRVPPVTPQDRRRRPQDRDFGGRQLPRFRTLRRGATTSPTGARR